MSNVFLNNFGEYFIQIFIALLFAISFEIITPNRIIP